MPDRPRLELNRARLACEPGGAAVEAAVGIRNQGALVDQFTLTLEGLDPAWYRLSESSVNLFPDARAEVHLEVQVPEGTAGGPHPFRIVATSRRNPEVTAVVEATLDVTIVGTVQLALAPRRRRAPRAAVYTVLLKNRTNAHFAGRLEAGDPDEALRLQLELADLSIPAGADGAARLRVRPRRTRLVAPEREHPFTVTALRDGLDGVLADPADGVASLPLETRGEFVRTPLLPFLAALPFMAQRAALMMLPLLLMAGVGIWLLARPGTRHALVQLGVSPALLAIALPLIARFGLNLPTATGTPAPTATATATSTSTPTSTPAPPVLPAPAVSPLVPG